MGNSTTARTSATHRCIICGKPIRFSAYIHSNGQYTVVTCGDCEEHRRRKQAATTRQSRSALQ